MPRKTRPTNEQILEEIRDTLHHHSSFRFAFVHGIAKGLGTVVGATVVVAIATSIALQFRDVALVGDVLSALVSNATHK